MMNVTLWLSKYLHAYESFKIFLRDENPHKTLQVITIFLSLAPAKCQTWPTKDGGCCVFPFLYQGRLRDSCVFDGQGKLWCSITENYDIDKMSGVCEGKKP